MKRRRGRRGFWWWSWLLALTTLGGVLGGSFYGKKRWEEAPKDYVASATLSFHVRDPFISRKKGIQVSQSRLADANEAQVLRETKSDVALEAVVSDLELTKKWGMETAEAVGRLRMGLELDLNKEKDELYVIVTLNDPAEAALAANAIAEGIVPRIKAIDDINKAESEKQLELEVRPFSDVELEARGALKAALAAKDVKIEPEPGVDLGPYLFIPEVLAAKLEWDSARENLASTRQGQLEYASYWKKKVRPSLVTSKAEAPPGFVGPEMKPFQVEWSLYGMTGGLVLGSLLMLVCWKLFP